jgi:hypothetical protein
MIFPFYIRWENAGVTNLNHIMDTVTKNFLTFEKIKTLIKSNNFIRYYTLISNIPTDIKGKSSIDTKLSRSRDKHSFIFNFTSGFAKYKL